MKHIKSRDRVFIQGAAATPNRLIDALVADADRLSDVELIHLHTIGPARYAESQFKKSFRVSNLFVGENMRDKMDFGHVDYLPCFLSEIPMLFRSGRRKLDVAMIHVSPPDSDGYCSLGTSVDVTLAAVESAPLILAQMNPQMPRIHGGGKIHVSRIHHYIEIDEPILESKPLPVTPEEKAIGKFASEIIEDGATLQVGIGGIPDAVLSALKSHKHLGVHSEMWSDGMLELIQSGAVDNSHKKIHQGITVSGFVMGSKALYDFVNDNPLVQLMGIDHVNDPHVIAQNPKVTAINSAVEIDLTGQVCADSVGTRIISGVGGQMDFMRGASLSQGGKPIIALTSRTKKGQSRIVPILKAGAGVVTTRAHVHYVITEYGCVDLFGKTLHERAEALISIAHPDDRESLERESFH